jgi:hypothetical protein
MAASLHDFYGKHCHAKPSTLTDTRVGGNMIHCTIIPDIKRVDQFRWVGLALTGNDPKPEETPVRIPPDQPEAPPVEKPVERPGEMPTPEIPPIEKPREIPPEGPEIIPPSDQAAKVL